MKAAVQRSPAARIGPVDSFVAIPHFLLESPAWLALSPIASKVFVGVLALYDGRNNGFIAMSAAETAAELYSYSKGTAWLALSELEERGFLEPAARVYKGGGPVIDWRITFLRCDRTRRPPSNAFTQRGRAKRIRMRPR
jgi:hypothetical protein